MMSVISFIFALGIIVLIHELGHFLVAKHYGILCHEFSIGMGPAIYSKRVGETVYAIRLIPIGGYVAMAGEEAEKDILSLDTEIGLRLSKVGGRVERIYLKPTHPEAEVVGKLVAFNVYDELFIDLEVNGAVLHFDVLEDAFYVDEKQSQQIAPYSRCLESKSKFARFATMVAGAMMNFVLAFVIMLGVGLAQGEQMFSNEVATVVENSPASEAGLTQGDVIVDINDMTISNWEDVTSAIAANGDALMRVTVEREGEYKTLDIKPQLMDGSLKIGISPPTEPIATERSLGYALNYSIEMNQSYFTMVFDTFKMIFVTNEASISDLSGPVGIFTATSEVATHGIAALFMWVAMLSVNIGILNLLPLPALDGGRIVFVLIEAIIGRPVDRKLEMTIHTVGLLLFFGLFLYVTFNDVFRLFGS